MNMSSVDVMVGTPTHALHHRREDGTPMSMYAAMAPINAMPTTASPLPTSFGPSGKKKKTATPQNVPDQEYLRVLETSSVLPRESVPEIDSKISSFYFATPKGGRPTTTTTATSPGMSATTPKMRVLPSAGQRTWSTFCAERGAALGKYGAGHIGGHHHHQHHHGRGAGAYARTTGMHQQQRPHRPVVSYLSPLNCFVCAESIQPDACGGGQVVRCERCLKVRYCSVECRASDARRHKTECQLL